MQLSPVAFFFAGLKQPGLKPAAGYGPLNPRRPGWEPRVAYSHSIESDGPYRSRSEQNSRPIQNPSSVPPPTPHLKLAKRAAALRRLEARRPWRRGGCARRRSVQQDESRALPRRTWPRRPCFMAHQGRRDAGHRDMRGDGDELVQSSGGGGG